MAGFRFRRRGAGPQDHHDSDSSVTQTDTQYTEHGQNYSKVAVKQATKTRRNAIIFACFCYLMTLVFLIVVEVGNTPGSGPRQNIYFFKLDLADIIAQSLPQGLILTNSIARTLGLHDFYQVGLWNFCEGYLDEGITYCSQPQAMYWFNPVQILLSELFAGASIALPSEVNNILDILQIASHVMFGCFLAALCLSFVLIIASPIVLRSRLWSGVLSVFAFLNSLLIIVGSAVGTAMGLIAQYALSSQPELNVKCELGITMYVLMWIAAGFSVLAFFVHAGMCCCCTSRRDIRTGRRNIVGAGRKEGAAGGGGVAHDYTERGGATNGRSEGVVDEEKTHGYSLPKFTKMRRKPTVRS
ncbi:SUR7/PalI family-domain-containing protein [Microdochium trichocladiopsis]|uniref:SUR7/PalI family-domain-containing protein n=1 Tax=Microdochium trichocladiopsis TaxID=1682393 RepID=A0A9P9BMU1_9PEZI|nr:SUR7/PalI family-domain-containing protein [Microdochium trichocladiopsis]KAH7026231.1 SUR7/PalI family-domain-containing protein [Microdochium trichocladiopsis]